MHFLCISTKNIKYFTFTVIKYVIIKKDIRERLRLFCIDITRKETKMRKIENSDNWYEGYRRDIQIAQTELALCVFSEATETLCDVYSLPSHNHQTFYCRFINENGFIKIEYAKAVQNSIWFSEPIYMYRFEEAKAFVDHPIRNGRILCGKKIVRYSLLEQLLQIINSLSEEQPDDLVDPSTDSELTAVRIYDQNKATREILYTDSEKLAFREEDTNGKSAEYLRNLHLYIEKIIGVG